MKKNKETLFNDLKTSIDYIRKVLGEALNLKPYSEMRQEIAKAIAVKIRVLLHDTNKSTSLCKLLGIKESLLFSPFVLREEFNLDFPANLFFSSPLLILPHIIDDKLVCEPNITEFNHKICCTFECWWNEVIIDKKDESINKISRRAVVLTLANKYGGAHIDIDEDYDYNQINYNSGFKWIDEENNIHEMSNNFYCESIFAIASEVLDAFEVFNKFIKDNVSIKYFIREYTVCIAYNQNGLKSYRYIPIRFGYLRQMFCTAFDYKSRASYSLFRPYLLEYRVGNNQRICFLVYDITQAKRLVYLRCDNPHVEYLLLKHDKGYVYFDNEDALFNYSLPEKTIGELKAELVDDPKIFDSFLNKQDIE